MASLRSHVPHVTNITTAAVALAEALRPGVQLACVFAHRSAEGPHTRWLAQMGVRPLLDLDLRLGEGSGAALAVPLLRQACRLHAGMATFAEAAVSDRPA